MAAFGEGMVGAEVVVDGTVWAILRPLGLKRRHVAVSGGDLDSIAGGEGSATGLAAFLDAVSASFVPTDIAPLFPEQGGRKTGWLAALAWAARDQECRFGSVLGWRDPGSGSESPVGDWSAATRADAIRAFLRAITVEEQTIRGDKARLKREHDAAGQRADHQGVSGPVPANRDGPRLALLIQQVPDIAAAEGEQWPVTIAIDGLGGPRTAKAKAEGDVVILFGNPTDLERIHSGSVLMVRSASEVVEYRLDGAKQALIALNTCVSTLAGK